MFGRTALIFLHGSGGKGSEIRGFLESLPLPNYQYNTFREVLDSLSIDLYTPTADMRRYSAAGGERMNVWFDRTPRFISEGMNGTEDLEGIERSLTSIQQLIQRLENENPYDHYILGGFSMGGGLSLHALRKQMTLKLRGIFCISSFAPENSSILTELTSQGKTIPVMMMHGEQDSLISYQWGKQTSANFLLKDIKIQFETYPDLDHEMSEDELSDLIKWIQYILSESLTSEKRYELRDQILEQKYDHLTAELKIAEDTLMDIEHAESKQSIAESKSDAKGSTTITSSSSSAKASAKRSAFEEENLIPYTIDYNEHSTSTLPQVTIRFAIAREYIPVLTARPILACGSTFEILNDSPNGVKTIVITSDPNKTAYEISKRLHIRLTSGSSTLNPCVPS